MTYFNMIKIIESTGIGLVYGLRFYENGQLDIKEMVTYVQVKKSIKSITVGTRNKEQVGVSTESFLIASHFLTASLVLKFFFFFWGGVGGWGGGVGG